MRGFLAVARREIAEKRFVFAAAAVASLVPFLVSIARGLHGPDAAEARQWTALILASAFGAGLVIVLGVSVLAKEIADRRIGFYFARPISATAVWAGKLVAAFLMTIAAMVAIALPSFVQSFVSGQPTAMSTELPPFFPLLVAGGAIAALLLLHVASVAVRSRSALLAVDIVALVCAAAIVFLGVRRLAFLYAAEAVRFGLRGLAVMAVLGILLGGAVAVTRGRIDIRAAHRHQSAVLWSVIGAGALAFLAFGEWVRAAKPSDLGSIYAARSLGGWAAVKGEARGAMATFLIDSYGRRHQRTIVLWEWPRVSGDGAVAAWLERELSGAFELVTLRLTGQDAQPERHRLFLTGDPRLLAISAHGDQVAVSASGALSLLESATGRSVGSARVPENARPLGAVFLGSGRIRSYLLIGLDVPEIQIGEFDAAARVFTITGRVSGLRANDVVVTSPSGQRLLVTESWGGNALLVDGRSGTVLRDLVSREPSFGPRIGFLSDDRIVLSSSSQGSAKLTVFSNSGALERTVEFPASAPAFLNLGGEIAPGQLVMGLASRGRDELFLVDIDAGRYRKVADGLDPRVRGWWFAQDGDPLPIGEGAKLFLDGRSLVHFDPLTGERRVLLGKTSER